MTTQECIDKHELSHVESKLSYRDILPEEIRKCGIWIPYSFLEKYMQYEVMKSEGDPDVRFDEFRRSMDLSNAYGSIHVLTPMLRTVNVYKFPYQNNGIFACTEMEMCKGEGDFESCDANIMITQFDDSMVKKVIKMHHPMFPKHINYQVILRSDCI